MEGLGGEILSPVRSLTKMEMFSEDSSIDLADASEEERDERILLWVGKMFLG